ncbi:hypothetical protein [Streptomyces sp. AC495_CC817]|uniref:hypothetical protein n=1 Tax=unclassified Streptomyces TaxID=2593676 RepID=UPI0035A88674
MSASRSGVFISLRICPASSMSRRSHDLANSGLAAFTLYFEETLGLNADARSLWLATVAFSPACVCHLGVIVSYGPTVTSGVPDEEQGLTAGLVTSTQQVGLTISIPLLGVLATTSSDLLTGLHTVLAVETTSWSRPPSRRPRTGQP